MSFKVQIIGEALVVTDTVTSAILVDVPKADYYYSRDFLEVNNELLFYNLFRHDDPNSEMPRLDFEQVIDANDVKYTKEAFLEFARTNLGQNIESLKKKEIDTNNASGDAFGRLRVSNLETLFESKQLFDDKPEFWDEALVSGAGITSSHDPNEAATRITSTLNTAGRFIRQTYMRFNYQAGKSQQIVMTGNLGLSGGGTGVVRRLGQYDDNNGIFFELDENGVMHCVVRSNYTGTPVDTKISQTDWDIPIGYTPDWTKAHIFAFDYQWLGVGRVRWAIEIGGVLHYVALQDNAGANEGVYMSTPNLPLRYEMITTVSSPASSMSSICTTVASEGGTQDLGTLHYKSTGDTHLNANSVGTSYAVIGIRLKSDYLGTVIKNVRTSLLALTNDNFEWFLVLNPTVAGTFTYADEPNSSVQTVLGVTANTVTGGVILDGGYITGNSSESELLTNALYLGTSIAGVRDEIVLCVKPLTVNLDVLGYITWREIN